MREARYYLRSMKDKRPVVTVVVIEHNGMFHRGVSICSPLDPPSKKVGYCKARGRALKAINKPIDFRLDINRDEALGVLWTCCEDKDDHIVNGIMEHGKTAVLPFYQLNALEQKIFKSALM